MRTGLECCGPNVHGDLDDSDSEQIQDETAIAHKLADEWAIAPKIPDSMRSKRELEVYLSTHRGQTPLNLWKTENSRGWEKATRKVTH